MLVAHVLYAFGFTEPTAEERRKRVLAHMEVNVWLGELHMLRSANWKVLVNNSGKYWPAPPSTFKPGATGNAQWVPNLEFWPRGTGPSNGGHRDAFMKEFKDAYESWAPIKSLTRTE